MQPIEATFTIDAKQRIVRWSHAAAAALSVPEEEASGKPCYEVVRGLDPFGRAVCQPGCPAVRALLQGQLTSGCSLLVEQDGGRGRFQCRLVALPGPSGGAVGTLVKDGQRWPDLSATAQAAAPRSSTASALATLHDLATVGTLSASLSANSSGQGIDQTLDWLRQAAGAEIAELFLAEPRGGDMLLTAFRGPFRAAFYEINRFHLGQGFPGLVMSHGEPVLTRDLPGDHRYLRSRVKEKGFHSYVCVPLRNSSGIVGAINVAARRTDMDIERASQLLSWASVPMSTAMELAVLRKRLSVGAMPGGDFPMAPSGFEGLLRGLLHQLTALGKASDGVLLLSDASLPGVARQVAAGVAEGWLCPEVRDGGAEACPALKGGHGVALYGPRHRWPLQCRQVQTRGGVVYCLPLIAGERQMGIVQLRYTGGAGLSLPTKHMADLLHMAEQAAQVIQQASTTSHDQERTALLHSEEQPAPSARAVYPSASFDRPAPQIAASDARPSPPFLDIRCFGSFELYREGQLITQDMVQRRGALTLLKILLIHIGRRVPRDLLEELLWPETEPRAADNRLHVLVHALRRLVEPSHKERRWAFICSDGDCYYFNPKAPYRLDTEDFLKYVHMGEGMERGGNGAGAIDAYEAAISLYRGDFLEDEPYAEWCWEERERLRETYLVTLGKLAALHADKGKLETSIECYRRALRIDPLREQNHQALMRVLWAAGRRDEALRQYQTCRGILLRELNFAPLPETEELHLRIKNDGHTELTPGSPCRSP